MSSTARSGETKQTTASGDAEPRSISKDDVFHLLQNGRRRAVLRYMTANPQEEYEMRALAEEVAAWEHDTTVDDLTSSERQRVYIALYQSHLPKLADHGVIDYDQDRGVVVPTRLAAVLDPYLGDGLGDDGDITASTAPETEEDAESVTGRLAALFS